MDAFHRFAFFTTARDAAVVTFAASVLMLAFSFEPSIAFAIGANIALGFALIQLLRVACLSDEGIVHTEVWRILKPEERPAGTEGRRTARDDLQVMLLRFARIAVGSAVLLYTLSLFFSLSRGSRTLHAVVSPPLG